jgi:hypothetical protein
MLRTRPAGVAMIVIAALVSTSTAYLLATRTLEQAGPAGEESAVALPATIDEHEAAVQATLLCLAAAGLAPLAEPTRAKSVTRITVDPKSVDPATAEAIIADCGADAEVRMLDGIQGGTMLRATAAEQQSTRASLDACLPGSVVHAGDGSGEAICLEDFLAATGLQALGTPQ